jgi:hypothetical protein
MPVTCAGVVEAEAVLNIEAAAKMMSNFLMVSLPRNLSARRTSLRTLLHAVIGSKACPSPQTD